jgi:Leucine-rich repeat (LRR) protein
MALAFAAAVAAAEPKPAEVARWIAELGGEIETGSAGRVTSVSLPYAWVTDADIETIAALPGVQKLDLSLSLITDAGMESLKVLNQVSDLNLFAVEQITDTALAYIRGWRKLERLNLRGTDVTDTTLQYLAEIPSLRALDVSYTQVTNNGLEHLAALQNLEELSIGGNKVTGAGLRVLKLLPALRSLRLSGAQKRNSGIWSVSSTDLDLAAIAALQRLALLDLGGVKVTDAGVARLKPLVHLQSLDLSRTQVSAKGLESLSLRGLERLNLWQAQRVDDAAAEPLVKLDKLAILDLSETGFGDVGLGRLGGSKSLRRLFLRGSKVSAAGVDAFRSANPDCEVSW